MAELDPNTNLSIIDMEGEVWKDIEIDGGIYIGEYQISNMGRIKSLKRLVVTEFQEYLIPERILRLSISLGYCKITISHDGILKSFKVHRLVAQHFIPNPKRLPQVNHKKRIRSDNRASELEWCTAKENTIHAFKLGHKGNQGEKCFKHILKNEDVFLIKRLFNYGITNKFVAELFNIHKMTVSAIRNNRSWKHIQLK